MAIAPRRRLVKALNGDYALDNWHAHRVDRDTFTIYVGVDPRHEASTNEEVGVDHMMADRFDLNLDILRHIDPKRSILIHMSTCGGDWEAGMQMFGAMLAAPNPITVLGTRHCRSMSSIIPLAADRFYMRPPTEYMFHYGTWGYEGHAGPAAWTEMQQLRKFNDMMLRIYVARLKDNGKYSKWHPSKIRHMLENELKARSDVFLSTDEAVSWGFSDGVSLGPVERASKRDMKRRNSMMGVLRKPVTILP